MFSKLVALALLSVATAAPTSSPTFAPSMAPTSAPTAAPEDASTPPTTTKPPAENVSTSAAGSTEPATETTKNATGAKTTTFIAKLTLDSPAAFDVEKYKLAIAATTGANVETVSVKSLSFTVTTRYNFPDDVVEADVKAAVVKQLSVAEDKVNVTIFPSVSPAARRLRAGRRLASLAEVTVVSDTVEGATAAMTGLNQTNALATELNVTAPVVVSSGVTVTVETEIAVMEGDAVAAPAEGALAAELSNRLNVVVGVEVEEVDTPAGTTTTDGPLNSEGSGARSKELVLTPLMLLALACSSFLF